VLSFRPEPEHSDGAVEEPASYRRLQKILATLNK
jgi:hypothetical protein